MIDRVGEIERRLDRLEERLRRAEERLSPGTPPPLPASAAPAAPGVPAVAGALSGAGTVLSILGRTVFVLGGGFLIRALTESGTVSREAGVAVGLAYGILWLFLAFRVSGGAAGAAFHGVTGIAIAFPLIWEATVRLSVFSPAGAIAAASAVTAIALAAAGRQPGSALAWTATAASLVLLAALTPASGRIDLAAAALIALAAATEILAYARRWPGPRWLAAGGADLAVVALAAVVARDGGLPDAYRAVLPALSLAVALALPLSTLAVFGVRLVSRRREATAFESIQSGAALLAGFGGAVAIAHSGVGGEPAIAAAALAAAFAFYAVAFRFFSRAGLAANFHLSTSLGLLMAVFGAAVALAPFPRALFWGAAAAALAAARGAHRGTLAGHGAVLLFAAASCGLGRAVFEAFLLPPSGPPLALSPAALAGAGFAFAAALLFRGGPPGVIERVARLVAVAVAAAGAGVVAMALLGRASPAVPVTRAVPIERMAVIAASSVLLAAFAKGRRRDLRFVVYPLLVVGAVKLLFDDLPHGTPASRFAAFALYGAALFAVPRLLRSGTDR